MQGKIIIKQSGGYAYNNDVDKSELLSCDQSVFQQKVRAVGKAFESCKFNGVDLPNSERALDIIRVWVEVSSCKKIEFDDCIFDQAILNELASYIVEEKITLVKINDDNSADDLAACVLQKLQLNRPKKYIFFSLSTFNIQVKPKQESETNSCDFTFNRLSANVPLTLFSEFIKSCLPTDRVELECHRVDIDKQQDLVTQLAKLDIHCPLVVSNKMLKDRESTLSLLPEKDIIQCCFKHVGTSSYNKKFIHLQEILPAVQMLDRTYQLTQLELSKLHVSAESLEQVAQYDNLNSLSLTSCTIASQSSDNYLALVEHRSLDTLNITDAKLEYEHLVRALAHSTCFPQLEINYYRSNYAYGNHAEKVEQQRTFDTLIGRNERLLQLKTENPDLTTVDYDHYLITDVCLDILIPYLNSNHSIASLLLAGHQLTENGLIQLCQSVSKNKNITTLKVSASKLNFEFISHFIVETPSVTHLIIGQSAANVLDSLLNSEALPTTLVEPESLNYNKIRQRNLKIKALRDDPPQEIQSLEFGNMFVSDVCLPILLDVIGAHPEIKKIDIRGYKFSEDGVLNIFKALKAHNNVTEIDLRQVKIQENVFRALVDFVSSTKPISYVDLNGYRLSVHNHKISLQKKESDFDVPVIDDIVELVCAAIKNNPNLQAVDLSNNKLPDEKLSKVLQTIVGQPNIRSLSLSNNCVGDQSMTILAQHLRYTRLLHALDLKNSQLSSAAVLQLTNTLKANTSLTEIDISDNQNIILNLKAIADALRYNKTLMTLRCLDSGFPKYMDVSTAQKSQWQKQDIAQYRALIKELRNTVTNFCTILTKQKKKNKDLDQPNKTLIACELLHDELFTRNIGGHNGVTVNPLETILHENKMLAVDCYLKIQKIRTSSNIDAIEYDKFEEFLENGVSPYFPRQHGDTFIHLAVSSGNIKLIERILRQRKNLDIAILNEQGMSPEQIAINNNRQDIVELLKNPDNAGLPNDTQPKKKKAKTKPKQLTGDVEELDVDEEAVVAVQPKHKKQKTIGSMPTSVSVLGLEKQQDLFSLLHAMQIGHEPKERLRLIKSLLESGASTVENDEFALHIAVCKGLRHTVRLLSRFGCDINQCDENNHSAVTLAVHCANIDILNLLLNDPSLTKLTVERATDYAKKTRAQQRIINLLIERYDQAFLSSKNNTHWLHGMQVSLSAGSAHNSLLIESHYKQLQLMMQNTFTQSVLTHVQDEEEVMQAKQGGNPVTAFFTFILSTQKHLSGSANTRDTITVAIELDLQYHLSRDENNEPIGTEKLKEIIKERQERGLSLKGSIPNKDIFIQPSEIKNKNKQEFEMRFHHGEQSLISALENDAVVSLLLNRLSDDPKFVPGCKVYGIILDVASPRYVCCNCEIGILSLQHPTQSVFLKKITDALVIRGCKVPEISPMCMVTRIGSHQAFERETVTADDHQRIVLDIRALGNKFILQQDLVQTATVSAQFNSRIK